jgi:serine/threonine protein phosphatase PrpC
VHASTARDPIAVAEFRLGDVRLSVAGGSEVGRRYPANFDVLHVDRVRPLVAVADGMGAGEGSAVAGRTTVDTFVAAVHAAGPDVRPDALRRAVAEAQRLARQAAQRLGALTGCTLTALVAAGEPGDLAAWLVQIGDSRAYRLRGGVLELLTVDHTVAWLGAVYGWYPAASTEAAAARYHLLRYVGHPDVPEPDVLNVSLRPGDVYCLCTDGLADQVRYQRLAEVLGGPGEPRALVDRLLGDARAGAQDNTTVAVVRVEPARPAAPGSP